MRDRLRSFFESDIGTAFFIYALLFLFLGRSDLFFGIWKVDFSFGIWQTPDEIGYLTRIDHFLSPLLQGLVNGFTHTENFYAPGAPVAWLPGALLARLIGPILGGDLVHWHWAFLSVTSSLYWVVAYILCLKIIEKLRFTPARDTGKPTPTRSHAVALAFMFCFQIIHYSFHRVLMSHGVELALSLATLHFVLADRFPAALISAAFLSITRFNDAPVFLLILGRYLDVRSKTFDWGPLLLTVRKNLLLVLVCITALAWVFKIAFISGYSKFRLVDVIVGTSTWDFFYFLMAPDWGVFWLIPIWLIGYILGIIYFRKLTWLSRAALIWFSLEMFLCIIWRSNGSDFGQRYLIGSTVGILVVWSDCLPLLREGVRGFFSKLLGWNAFWIFLLTLIFFTIPSTFVENEFFMRDAFRSLFDSEFIRKISEVSVLGSAYHTLNEGTAAALSYLKRPRSEVYLEGLWVNHALFAICAMYAGLYSITRTCFTRLENRSPSQVSADDT